MRQFLLDLASDALSACAVFGFMAVVVFGAYCLIPTP